MRFRSSHVRTKVVALLASLVALWGFAAFVTLREGLNLLSVNTLDQNVGRPSESLVDALQEERRISVVFLANHAPDQQRALVSQRTRTDAAVKKFRQLAGSGGTESAASDALNQRIRDVFGRLDDLGRTRDAIDNGNIDRTQASVAFTYTITTTFRIYGALSTLDDPEIAKEGRTLIALSRAREVLSQEDALLSGVLAAGEFAGLEHNQFVQLAGAQRLLYDDAAAELPPADQAKYQQFVKGATFLKFRAAEDLVIERGRVGGPTPIDAQTWKAAIEPVFAELRELVLQAADGTLKRATPAVVGVIVRLLLAGGLGLIAVIASIIISITTARSLVSQLEKLRAAAWELADERLPSVVDRLRRGESVDVATEAPPLTFGTDEIGQVGQAFNAVQETAVRVAVEQAELRRGVRDVFLSLARRTQALVHRQLTMLDAMERRETEPEDLDNLFRVDHLATRMRRNAENLIVLSGAVAGRGWRNPVPLVDVVRGAMAEVEEYERVTVLPMGSAALAGRAVGDVIHLLAELIENATSFSPPDTPVQVGGQKVANGFVLEIEDRGLGMTGSDLAEANALLSDPPEFKLSSTARLGLYVIGRLAQRHGIRVQLRGSPYGGTMAIALIPSALIVEEHDGAARPAVLGRREALVAAGAAIGGASRVPVEDSNGDQRDRPAGDSAPSIPISAAKGNGGSTGRGASNSSVRSNRPRGTDGSQPAGWEPPTSAIPRSTAVVERTPAPASQAPVPPAQPSPVGSPTPDQADDGEGREPVTHTPNGLPLRVRQANLAPPLQDDPEEPAGDGLRRTPEEIRTMMASYQRWTVRGRSEAERSLDEGTGRGDDLLDTSISDDPEDR